ncbi:BTAD domain-containing putative transcriptional regulator [Streptomyces sp. NPDC021225]|uniref:AfsR/SARP family transcriptional regulator n=1 Tax=Streptomyces sp. NPDC021225 TaxID=3365121 RepID=UPI00378C1EF2
MEFQLLGPLELWVNGSQQRLGSTKERYLLAVLLCADGAPVPADTLIRRIWDSSPPASGTATLQSNVSRLRSRLRAAVGDQASIGFSASSYTLHVPSDAVDLRRFERLYLQAREAAHQGDIQHATLLLRQAESLWRSDPLAEFSGGWATAMRRRLSERLRQVREQRINLELDLGRHADLVAELYNLADHEHDPEPYAKHLMLALHRCGRHGAALTVYRDTRRRLGEILGADPSPELENLHQRILKRDPGLLLQPSEPVRRQPLGPPDNLPRDISDFSGRRYELAVLLATPSTKATALPLTVIHGMGGVGKTALITHAAHRLRARYPDGCLYVHLRAHHGQPPVDAADALAILLQAVGVPAEGLPASLDARAALWRTRTAHRSVLLLLDDARSATQIRPLLPGTPTCQVFVTSRHRLSDLEGAQSLSLDAPDTAEAAVMFTRIAGSHRKFDSSAVRQIVALCDRHPLAIRLAANRFRHRDAWDVHDLAERLKQSANLLEEIDTPLGIAAAFDLSYAELLKKDQRFFRFLALHPGPDLSLHATAELAGVDLAEARRSVDELVDAHLLEEPVKDHYRFHDMVRDFARKTGEQHDTESERRDAERRVLNHYLAVADICDRLAYPQRRRLDVSEALLSHMMPEFGTADAASVWLDLNRGNLVAAARLAASEHPEHAIFFSHVLDHAFHVWGMWDVAAGLNASALTVARNQDNATATAQFLIERAALLRPQGAHREALRHAEEALARGRNMGDVWIQAEALEQIGIVDLVSGRLHEALQNFHEALPLHRQIANLSGEAEALNHQGITLAHLGHLEEATCQFRATLELHQSNGNMHGQIKALNNIGEIHSLQGRQEEAREYYERSLALVRKFGGRQQLAILYNNLGNVCRNGGDSAQALAYFQKALENYGAIRDKAGQTDSLVNLGITHLARRQYTEARNHLAHADEIAREIDDQQQRQRILAATAAIQSECGQDKTALETYREALKVAQDLGRRYEEAHAHEGIAGIIGGIQGADAAKAHLAAALRIYQELHLIQQEESIRQRLNSLGGEIP